MNHEPIHISSALTLDPNQHHRNPLDLANDNLSQTQMKQILLHKLKNAPAYAFKDKDLVQLLDRSKETVMEKQSLARVNSKVFLGGSKLQDGAKIESFDQMRGFNPSMSTLNNLRSFCTADSDLPRL